MRRRRLTKGARLGLRVSVASLMLGLTTWMLRQRLQLHWADGFTILVGVALMSLSGWAIGLAMQRRRKRRRRRRGVRPCVHCG